jgi:hypothetical protein
MSIISASTTSTTAYKVTADTTGTLVFQTGATPTTALTIGSDQSVTFAGAVNTTGNQVVTGNLSVTGSLTTTGSVSAPNTFGFKNRIINGGMVIDQRNAGASVTPTASSTYTLDRWAYVADAASKASVQQSSTAPTGFTKSILVTSLSAYSPGSTEEFRLNQQVEGLNIADLNWGTASAVSVTLSFWVRSSVTGSYSAYLANSGYSRVYVSAYTINAANTWEYKTITIPGCTDGTWSTTNTTGIALGFELAAGSAYYATNNTWNTSSAARCTSSQTNLVATNGATFYLTGVQLEKGSTATSFDYRPYGTELALCQRYYYYFGSDQANNCAGVGQVYVSTGFNNVMVPFPVTMRTTPSFTYSDLTHWLVQNASGSGVALTALSQVTTDASTKNGGVRGTVASGLVAGNAVGLYANSSSAKLNFSAEL